jgi:CPA2 family monovalent cation:H+ antiporter-2
MRDVFATLFFASIGLLIDPGFLFANSWVLTGLVAITLIGKATIVAGIVKLFGYPLKTALTGGNLGFINICRFKGWNVGVPAKPSILSWEKDL